MKKLKLLDLFCCAGGAGHGYSLAEFEVTGVDIDPQPKHPKHMKFVQSCALEYLKNHHHEFDVIHASPPCQAHTKASKVARAGGKEYECFIERVRVMLKEIGKPYIIENVPGAPMEDPFELCGAMFGLKTYRHRLFESNMEIKVPAHPEHVAKNCKMGRAPKPGEYIQVVGHFSGVPFAREAMGIGWMGQKELAQAIPPVYTEFIGKQIIKSLTADQLRGK